MFFFQFGHSGHFNIPKVYRSLPSSGSIISKVTRCEKIFLLKVITFEATIPKNLGCLSHGVLRANAP